MEETKKDLKKEFENYKTPAPYIRKRVWELLFISNDGKVISVKHYKGFITFVALLLVISISAAAALSSLYRKNLDEKRTISRSLGEANLKIKSDREELEMLMARLAVAESKIKKNTEAEVEKGKVLPPEPVPVKKKKHTKPKTVDISNLVTTRQGAGNNLLTSFKVRNISGKRPVSGRIYVLMKTDSENPADWLVSPPVLLQEGEPSSPEQGQLFSIKNFKTIKLKITNGVAPERYKLTTVFVYKENGGLLLEKTFPFKLKKKKR